MKQIKYIVLIIGGLFFFSCEDPKKETNSNEQTETTQEPEVPAISYEVMAANPHDTLAFTEGYLFHNNQLYESTGAPEELPLAESRLAAVDLNTGRTLQKVVLDRKTYFGEGMVIFKNKIYQLTYKNQVGFIYDLKSLKQVGHFSYQNAEGWGLTTDSTYLIMSDGTNILTYLDPETLKPVKTLNVTNNGYAEDYLNELEYIKGFIYANVWTKNYIVKINPKDGKIVGILDLSNLSYKAKEKYRGAMELNGIAYNPVDDKIYVTGKMWPETYQIKFNH